MSQTEGSDEAAWFNGRAKQVTPAVVRAFTQARPGCRVFVSRDLDEARRFARQLVAQPPRVLFCGGGDGTVATLLNLLREEGAQTFPTLALLKLGTGNGWPNAVGAPRYADALRRLRTLPDTLPTRHYDLVQVEDRICHFTGVGWDATLLSDYQRNLKRRQSQLVGSRAAARLHKGVVGYLYALFRMTVPEDITSNRRYGRPRVRIENLGEPARTLDASSRLVPASETHGALYDDVLSICCVGSEPEWGAHFKAFPFVHLAPGFLNVRVYESPALEAVRAMGQLWRGEHPLPGMHDFFVTRARLFFSRPMPWHVAGDPLGQREVLDISVAPQGVDLVDWAALP